MNLKSVLRVDIDQSQSKDFWTLMQMCNQWVFSNTILFYTPIQVKRIHVSDINIHLFINKGITELLCIWYQLCGFCEMNLRQHVCWHWSSGREREIWAWCSRLGRTKRAKILLQVSLKQEEGRVAVSASMKAISTVNTNIKKIWCDSKNYLLLISVGMKW